MKISIVKIDNVEHIKVQIGDQHEGLPVGVRSMPDFVTRLIRELGEKRDKIQQRRYDEIWKSYPSKTEIAARRRIQEDNEMKTQDANS